MARCFGLFVETSKIEGVDVDDNGVTTVLSSQLCKPLI